MQLHGQVAGLSGRLNEATRPRLGPSASTRGAATGEGIHSIKVTPAVSVLLGVTRGRLSFALACQSRCRVREESPVQSVCMDRARRSVAPWPLPDSGVRNDEALTTRPLGNHSICYCLPDSVVHPIAWERLQNLAGLQVDLAEPVRDLTWAEGRVPIGHVCAIGQPPQAYPVGRLGDGDDLVPVVPLLVKCVSHLGPLALGQVRASVTRPTDTRVPDADSATAGWTPLVKLSRGTCQTSCLGFTTQGRLGQHLPSEAGPSGPVRVASQVESTIMSK